MTFFEDVPQRMKTRVVGDDKGTNGFGFVWSGAVSLVLEKGEMVTTGGKGRSEI